MPLPAPPALPSDTPQAAAAPGAAPITKRGVCAVILHPDGLIALVQRKDAQGWALPGGTVDPGEDDVTALRREVMEETGLEAFVGPLLHEADVRPGVRAAAYLCAVETFPDPVTQPGEMPWTWGPRSDLLTCTRPDIRAFNCDALEALRRALGEESA